MKEIIEKVTNFINENTMLLIGICAFLIVVLIIYLIDNSIKTKKMQKAIKEMDEAEDNIISSNLDEEEKEIPESKEVQAPEKEEEKEDEPQFDSISLVDEDKEYDEVANEEVSIEPEVEDKEEIEISPAPVEEPKEESKFTNKKSLSEILAKKKDSSNNDADKTLDETTDFSNTF